MRYEDEKTEFKREFSDSIYKTVTAFANTDGGDIYIGVDDKGNIVGIENFDDTYTRIANGIRDSIFPDVSDLIQYTHEEGHIIHISVKDGMQKPYCLKSKGFRPEGVYIRQGASNSPASWELIKKMINNSNGIWEEQISIEQNLEFNETEKFFKNNNKDFDVSKFNVLKIRNRDYYTNLGWLMSDQCSFSVKIAVFSDISCTVFRDKQEFKGSVCRQFEDTLKYLDFANRTSSVIEGAYRTDIRDYPPLALRECLLNALVHRSYDYNGSVIININDTKTEFISLGGLMPGLTKEEIMAGVSVQRNPGLANIFFRLGLIEAYGTGIRRIYELYKDYSVKPEISITPNSFKIILPNINEMKNMSQNDIIIDYIRKNGQITEEETEKLLGIKTTRAYKLTKEMCDSGIITKNGRGINKFYTLK